MVFIATRIYTKNLLPRNPYTNLLHFKVASARHLLIEGFILACALTQRFWACLYTAPSARRSCTLRRVELKIDRQIGLALSQACGGVSARKPFRKPFRIFVLEVWYQEVQELVQVGGMSEFTIEAQAVST